MSKLPIEKWRKKPVGIEAVWLHPSLLPEDIAEWCGGKVVLGDNDRVHIEIPTLEGVMKAEMGDYIIKGVEGEFYPCHPRIFSKTYELVTDMELDQPTPTSAGDSEPPKHSCSAEIIAELERLRKAMHDNPEFSRAVIIQSHIEELKAKETQL